ncbi:MAG: hypothetical protein KUG82_21470 [Pseudomonadales bacterium]|nr:hypothetical protein [Pseudomonadales bacterium]
MDYRILDYRTWNHRTWNYRSSKLAVLFFTMILMCIAPLSHAHHVLGRPAYSLNEDSNTPPSTLVETQVGSYFVSYMVYPAFPKANEQGRVNLYASRISDGVPYDGEVHFTISQNSALRNIVNFFGGANTGAAEGAEEVLGSQLIDDGVYRQGFLFFKDGKYIVTARFLANGETHEVELPIRIGEASWFGPLGMIIAGIVCALIMMSLFQQKKVERLKVQAAARENHLST